MIIEHTRLKISKNYNLKRRIIIVDKKNYKISEEVFHFPYNGNLENNHNEMFSEKVCSGTVKIYKRIKNRIKWGIFFLEIKVIVFNAIIPCKAVEIPLPKPTSSILRTIVKPMKGLKVVSMVHPGRINISRY